jgi:TRAP-type mannitol/chloroaromatic compound transport system permease small subunit
VIDLLERFVRAVGGAVAWATVVPIAFFGGLQMLDRKLGLGVSAVLPDLSTSLLFILIFMTAGYTYLRDGHVRVDVLRRNWPPRRLAWIEILGCAFVIIPLSLILIWYGWDGVQRTTSFAETQIRVRRWAGLAGPVFLLLAGVVVLARNLAYLRGRRSRPAPDPARGLADDA